MSETTSHNTSANGALKTRNSANGEIALPAAPGLGLRPDLSRFAVLLDARHPS